MLKFLSIITNFLGGGVLDRVLKTIDAKIKNDTDREKLKTDIILKHYETKADFMNAGGFYLMLLFAVPLAFWYTAVILASVFWCAGCAYPQEWTVAALPSPLNEWSGLIVMSIFGVMGLSKLRK